MWCLLYREIKLGIKYSVEEIEKYILDIKMSDRDAVKVEKIGESVMKKNIYSIIMGSGKRCLIMLAGVHGRESINPIVMLYMIQNYIHLIKEYNHDLCVMLREKQFIDMLKRYTLVFVPLVNPDGYEMAMNEKNNNYNCLYKNNANNIDINRNFPSSSNSKMKISYPTLIEDIKSLEIETQNVIHLFHSLIRKRYELCGLLDFHSRGKSIYYYRAAMDKEYNNKCRKLAQKLAKDNGYKLENPSNEVLPGDTGGNSVNYFSEMFHLPALTIETVNEECSFPLNAAYQTEVYNDIKYIPLEYMQYCY